METDFRRVIVIGYGKAAGNILKIAHERQADYGYSLAFTEHEPHLLGITERLCAERGIPFFRLPDKAKLRDRLEGLREKTLIVSASNNYLFPAALTAREDIKIINFHNALLPDYPGRNAPSWAIFRGERQTGITWHYVTAGVDEGNIIIQKRCEIGPDEKAYELAERLMDLACEAFAACFELVLSGREAGRPQRLSGERRLYRAAELPGDGFFSPEEEPEAIYRLLRSVDYGKTGIFPPLETEVAGRRAEVLRYRKVPSERKTQEADALWLPLPDGALLKIKYRLL